MQRLRNYLRSTAQQQTDSQELILPLTTTENASNRVYRCGGLGYCQNSLSFRSPTCRQAAYKTSIATIHILKMSSAFLLWQSTIIADFRPDINIQDGWTITGSFLLGAGLIFGLEQLFFNRDNSPIRHTNHFIEVLEVGAFFYNLISLLHPPQSQNDQIGLLLASVMMMALCKIDPDISILKSASLNHKLPSSYGRNPLVEHDQASMPSESCTKPVLRLLLRSLHFCIPAMVTGISTYHVSEFVMHSAFDHAYSNIAFNIAISHALLTSAVRLYDQSIAQGLLMQDLRNQYKFQFAKYESAFSVFVLSAFQINYALGDWIAAANYLNNHENTFNGIDTHNLQWSIPFLWIPNLGLSIMAAYDNADMYEEFFAYQDKLYNCMQNISNLFQTKTSLSSQQTSTDWLKYIKSSNEAPRTKKTFCESMQVTMNHIWHTTKSYFERKVPRESNQLSLNNEPAASTTARS